MRRLVPTTPDASNDLRASRGFTLVELVIVLVIIGVVMAIAAARMPDIKLRSAESALRNDLHVLRQAIEFYKVEHNGVLPGAVADGGSPAGSGAAMRKQLTRYTDAAGQSSKTPGGHPFGPYLFRRPIAPLGPAKGDDRFKMYNAGTPLSGGNSPGRAWRYDWTTGELIFSWKGLSSDGTTRYDEW